MRDALPIPTFAPVRRHVSGVLVLGALLAAVLLPLAARAAGADADTAVRAAVKVLAPQLKIDKIEAAPMPGFRQVIVGGQVVYVSDDGRYLMQGTLFDTQARIDLTSARAAIEHKNRIDAVPQNQRIVFGPAGQPRYKVTVFTDIDCGYCRKLHSEIAEINKLGIEVDYLFFPRSGPNTPSYDKAVAVWCAADRKAAFSAAKAGVEPKPAQCDNPVAAQFELGNEVGVTGTPTILAPDGSRIGGYLPPEQLLARLQALDKKAPAGS